MFSRRFETKDLFSAKFIIECGIIYAVGETIVGLFRILFKMVINVF